MIALDPTSLNLTGTEALDFSRELDCLGQRLGRKVRFDRRLTEDLLVIYRRRQSQLNEMERLFRPEGALFLNDWADEVVGAGGRFNDLTATQLRMLIGCARRGITSVELASLVNSCKCLIYSLEVDASYRECSLRNLRAYLDYLRDFAPFMSPENNAIARRQLMTIKDEVSADLIARYLSEVWPTLLAKLQRAEASALQNATWFDLYRRYIAREESLPTDYLDTPFAEVLRNAPAQAWFDVSGYTSGKDDWPFAIGQPGFYSLAAGNSARAYLKEIGIGRSAWRAYVALPLDDLLSAKKDPVTYVWALGLGACQKLAELLPDFMPSHLKEQWLPIVQQLIHLDITIWPREEGLRILGFVYHIIRDQPDFRLDLRWPEAILEAASDHYQRIAASFAEIRRQREEVTEVEDAHREVTAEEQRMRTATQRKEYEKWLRSAKWENLGKANKFRAPASTLRMLELTNGWELFLEGQAMSNCVADYTQRCLDGVCAIFSLRHKVKGREVSLMTIRVQIQNRAVLEARGRFNQKPAVEFQNAVNDWASASGFRTLRNWE